MFVSLRLFAVFCSITCVPVLATKCGCKSLSPCYINMLEALHQEGESYCIEEAAIGSSATTIFLLALKDFCHEVISVEVGAVTSVKKNLYEVVIHDARKKELKEGKEGEDTPTIIIDAGQEAMSKSTEFGLFIIEQLVACQENLHMIRNVKWVIMPSTNPEGLEYARLRSIPWHKNIKADALNMSFGVDVSRNFDEQWSGCPKVISPFSWTYPGEVAGSEQETIFIKNIVTKHKKNAKIYLSIRGDGHHIAFPHASSEHAVANKDQLQTIAGAVAAKVNLRSGGVHSFKNDSIYNLEGKKRCGHSVDWALATGISWPFEMRVFLESDNDIMSLFQTLPRGYDDTLRNGYFTGIRELYTVLTNKKKYGKLHF